MTILYWYFTIFRFEGMRLKYEKKNIFYNYLCKRLRKRLRGKLFIYNLLR